MPTCSQPSPRSTTTPPGADFEPGHPPYLGQLFTTDVGKAIQWRKGAKRRVLAYLRPGKPNFETGVRALSRLKRGTDVILAAPGASQTLSRSLAGTPVRVVAGPVLLEPLLRECDLGISHASNRISAAFIMAGIPQVGLPTQTEQAVVARTVPIHRLGLGILGSYGPDQAYEAITKALAGEHL